MLSISEISSSPQQSPFQESSSLRIQWVSKSVSERLLTKFPDVSEFDIDYSQSRLWSPPIKRIVFLSPPGKISNDHEMVKKLRMVLAARQRRRYNLCLSAYLCFSRRLRSRS